MNLEVAFSLGWNVSENVLLQAGEMLLIHMDLPYNAAHEAIVFFTAVSRSHESLRYGMQFVRT